MRVRFWGCALMLLGCAQFAHAETAESDGMPLLEIIEMLGEMDDDTGDLEIAMSDEILDQPSELQEEKNAK